MTGSTVTLKRMMKNQPTYGQKELAKRSASSTGEASGAVAAPSQSFPSYMSTESYQAPVTSGWSQRLSQFSDKIKSSRVCVPLRHLLGV